MLVDIAKASTYLVGSFGGYRQEDRIKLVNDIINQQSDKLFDITHTISNKNTDSDYRLEEIDR